MTCNLLSLHFFENYAKVTKRSSSSWSSEANYVPYYPSSQCFTSTSPYPLKHPVFGFTACENQSPRITQKKRHQVNCNKSFFSKGNPAFCVIACGATLITRAPSHSTVYQFRQPVSCSFSIKYTIEVPKDSKNLFSLCEFVDDTEVEISRLPHSSISTVYSTPARCILRSLTQHCLSLSNITILYSYLKDVRVCTTSRPWQFDVSYAVACMVSTWWVWFIRIGFLVLQAASPLGMVGVIDWLVLCTHSYHLSSFSFDSTLSRTEVRYSCSFHEMPQQVCS